AFPALELAHAGGRNPAVIDLALDLHRPAVLLCGIDMEGELIVDVDVVELRRRLVVLRAPRFAAILADARSAVVARDHDRGVPGIDPEHMHVAMRRMQRLEGVAAVGGFENTGNFGRVDRIDRLRISVNAREVPGPLSQFRLVIGARPGVAPIVRAEYAAGLGFDQRVEAVWIRARNRDRDLADRALRQARIPGDIGPVRAAIDGLVDPAA